MRTIICFLLLALAGNCIAASPREVVSVTVNAVLETLSDASLNDETKRRQIKGIVGRHFDFRAMASRVLATNWKKADKTQRARFTHLFKELLSNTYWTKISAYTNERVEVTGERLRSEKLATVNTIIKTDTLDIPVDYKLYQRESDWFVYDVVIEQVSLVRNYRGSFQQIVRDEGIDGLISQLETKVAESSAEEYGE
jgi:phospholipid transport system substrate-binding protein